MNDFLRFLKFQWGASGSYQFWYDYSFGLTTEQISRTVDVRNVNTDNVYQDLDLSLFEA
jgi:hypothetical protein